LCCCCCCGRCVGVIALITLEFLPYCAGIVALFAFALPPASQTGICPVTKQLQHALASLLALRHCCCRVALASSPLSRRHLCPCCAGIAALVMPALMPASQTGICPVMTQLQHVAGEASLLCSSLLPMASLLYLASAHGDLAFNGLAKAAMAFFGVALVSLPALHWHHCQRGAVFVTGVVPGLLPSWLLKVWPVQCWCLPALR
jgi:hypothetical protein